ncbi:hypothetical protein CTAYLR_004142 [Chrysophaeum taylorii]|uniref:F-actin-capping protein subunit alpha n=1 Tax=Chrysophaeum taylorii TaxID=2483200 RepID=A0AAD7UL35_9STRA|nr:hypothetical protein CTAYLR_004142 [Chrysophaeum taylorii]
MEDEEEAEEATPEEKLQIAQHFLLHSPPGQFGEVLADVQALVPGSMLDEGMIKGIARVYNCTNYRGARTDAGGHVILSKEGEIDLTHYVDTQTGNAFEVDHVSMEATLAEDFEGRGVDETAKAVEDKVREYVMGQYSSDAECAVYAVEAGLLVVVRSEKINLRNYWSGNWISTWNVYLGDAPSIAGTLKIHAHYFEDGNVQLQTHKVVPAATLPTGDIAAAIAAHIEAAEADLQAALEQMYAGMSHETFKAMRRIMPITRTKMKWNINEVALNINLRK